MLKDIYLAGSARTALGAFCGAFSEVSAVELGKTAVRAAITRSGVKPEDVDELFVGNILSGSLRPNAARQVGIGAGLPLNVPATTINVLCASGMKAIATAAQVIQAGDAEVVIAGGIENMTRSPYLLDKARTGFRLGHGEIYDSMLRDALLDAFDGQHMGVCADKAAARYSITREELDDFAIESYKRAILADKDGTFAREIAPVEVAGRKGKVTVIDHDEEPGRFNEEKFRSLSPAFGKNGTATAGNSSSINDGAAALVVASGDKASKLGLNVEARIVGYAMHAQEPEWFTLAPIGAMGKLLKNVGWSVKDVDLFEINEAFSVVPMAAMKDLCIPHEKLNVHGGAVCLGHPIGASGARVIVTLINALKTRGKKTGVASLCVGGGMGIAMAIELV
ncbi:MAG: thiolase family protein [Verrucomicrobiota bacterium]